jgi:hypothetical protein
MISNCFCLNIVFKCSDDSTFEINFSKGSEYFNGKPKYFGSIGSDSYEIYYNGVVGSYWVLVNQDSPTNFIYQTTGYTSISPSTPCNTEIEHWEPIDLSNFKYCLNNTESPVEIFELSVDIPGCIKSPTGDTCGDCGCWFFSGESEYNIRFYSCDNKVTNFRLNSGGTANFCLKGSPVQIPSTTLDFFSEKKTNSCFLDCVPTGYCECITVILDDTENMEFYVGGTQNGKTFWRSDYFGDDFKIFWNGTKWLFVLTPVDIYAQTTIIAESNTSGLCPPNGTSTSNWNVFDLDYSNFVIQNYDCYPEFNTDKKCWTITATTEEETITFYDNLNTNPKKATLLYIDDTMEVCAYDKPISTSSATTIIETTGSCFTLCNSISLCGCIRLKITCQSETSTTTTYIDLVPSGTINGKPFYVFRDNIIAFLGSQWIYYNVTNNLTLAEIPGKNIVCPFDEPWEILLFNATCTCISIGSSALSFEVVPKICPQFPTPTPTPTPTPIPYVEPTCNECIPTTVFDMNVECIPTNPTTSTSSDGALSLSISGGTAPYEITWSNGNSGPDIFNLTEGSYTATTVDYYGDFTAVTICEIVAAKPTTTTTTTTEPPITGETLCMTISTIQSTGTTTESITFEPDGVVNGKLSWESLNGDNIIWNNSTSRWEVTFNPNRTYFVISLNPAFPPLNNWIVVGISGTVNVVVGECPLTLMLMNNKNKIVSFRSLINKDNNFNNLFL